MGNINYWSGVAVAMQSALAVADTITAITKANPGVASSASHGMANGAYALLSVQGMHQLEGRVTRLANVNAGDFELEGIDTTLFGTFSSGTAQEITFGTTLATMVDISAQGGDPEFADITTIHDLVRRQAPVVTSPFVLSFESIWDVADAGLIALKAASDAIAQRAFQFTFTTGQILVFNGYVSAALIPTGSAQDVVKTSITITSTGDLTVYAS